jgi:hypothetical protein
VEGQPLQLAASVVVKERSLFIIRVMYFIQVMPHENQLG